MGDIDECRVKGGLQGLQLNLHMFAQLEVQRPQRLIQQQHVRLQHHAARDGDPLLLPARKLIRLARADARQADPVKRLINFARDLGLGHAATAQPVADVLGNRHHREKRQMLEHHVHRALVRRRIKHRATLDPNVTRGGVEKPRDHPHDCCFAAARRPEDGEETAGRHREGDVINSGGIAEPLNEVDAFQIWGHVNSV